MSIVIMLIHQLKKYTQYMTGKQRAMIEERLKDPKASNAEIIKRAGYDIRGEGNKATNTASQIYLENMRNPEIASILNDALEEAERGVLEIASYSKNFGREGGKEGASYAAVALSAYKDVQDRVKGKATQKIESTSTSVNLNLSLTDITN